MSEVGCPIRRSTDQRLFAPSRSFSQRTTSFIASYRQGIHQMPLSHLIALICNAHHAMAFDTIPSAKKECFRPRALYPARIPFDYPAKRFVRIDITERPVHSRSPHARSMRSAQTNQKSIRLNPNIPLTRKICADSAGYAPQALVPLYDVKCVFTLELGSERN